MSGRRIYLTEQERRTLALLIDGRLVGRERAETAAVLRRVSVKLCCGAAHLHPEPARRRKRRSR